MAAGGATAARIVRHSSAAGEWLSATRAPDPRLRGLVHDYCGYVEQRLSFKRRLEVPAIQVPLIIGFGPAFRVGWPDGRGEPVAHHSFIAGMSDQYALVSSDGPADCLEAQLSPIGMHLILGLPMHELSNRTLELQDVLGPEADSIAERVYEAPEWDDRFAILDGFFLERLARARTPDPAVGRAWTALRRRGGGVEIGTLVEAAGWSHRHLIDRFREQLGLPPKMLARILRFSRVVRALDHAAPPN
jgi:hypothetical protein